ncbi:MAG: RDD family protein [Candidatus Brocadiae bacterium]|nr:RDD family protein [Candidatus Brocadiia bacterium]
MTLSLIYQQKRRRLVALMLLVLALMVIAMFWVPAWRASGPVWAARAGDRVAIVLRDPSGDGGEDASFRVSWRMADGRWLEAGPYTGQVTAVAGGESLLVYHGRSWSTYHPPREDGTGSGKDRWDSWPHHWGVVAAAREGTASWVFGLLDERTLAVAWLDAEGWKQGPELRRAGAVRDVTAAANAEGARVWWREDGGAWGSSVTRAGWSEPVPVGVPHEARMAAATVAGRPTLFLVTGLMKSRMQVAEAAAEGASWEVRKGLPYFSAGESVAMAGGPGPSFAVATGLTTGWTELGAGPAELAPLDHTFLRYRPGAQPWFISMIFASLGIVGIGCTLLFERRRVSPETIAAQARLLSTVAPLGLRILAAGIDTLPFLYVFGWLAEQKILDPLLATLGAVVACSVWCAAFEVWRGRTPGKMVAGLEIRRLDGTDPGLGRVIVRNLLRTVELLVMLIPAVLMVATTRSQRLGDLFSGTMVVRSAVEVKQGEEEVR